MKKIALSAERRYFPSFDFKFSPKFAIKFVAESLLLFLMASVPELGFMLAMAAFCGLVYARQNVIALAPSLVIACFVFDLNWQTPLFALCPIPFLVALYAIFFKFKRNVPLWAVALTALVGCAPYIVVGAAVYHRYLFMTLAVAALLAMTFIFGVTAYAALVRGSLKQLSVDEYICGGAALLSLGYALGGVNIYGFRAIYAVIGFCVLMSAICFKPYATLLIGILLGLGNAMCCRDMSALAEAAILATAAIGLYPFTKWSSAAGMLLSECVMWLLRAYGAAGWKTLIAVGIGVAVAVAMPNSVAERLRKYAADEVNCYTGIVNRRGRELAARLSSASDVFYELSKRIDQSVSKVSGYTPQRLSAEVARSFCGKCPDRNVCNAALGGDFASVLTPISEAALNRGKATILDVPPYIANRCSRMHSLTGVINSLAGVYIKKSEQFDGMTEAKKSMSDQFAGIALVLDSMASTSAEQVSFCGEDIESLRSELLKHNICAGEIVVSKERDNISVTMLVRACDAQKAMLSKIASRKLRTRLEPCKYDDRGDKKLVYLVAAPIFEVAYGVAERIRESEGVSGDSRSILCPSRSKRLFAICDGMGSGEEAARASQAAVQMIEGFYRAGFDNRIILSLVNKLLKLSLDDSFTSLDISIIDTSSGALDIIKLGSASSFIVRRDGFEVLSCSLPPAGILENIQPLTSRYQLFDGDMLIMMSDGVFDALEAKGVAEVVDALDTTNPQTIADGLLEAAVEAGAEDDCTVFALRLFSVT